MVQCILKTNGNVVPCLTPSPLNTTDLNSENENCKRAIFSECISKRWGTSISSPPTAIISDNLLDPYKDTDESPRDMPEFDEPVGKTTGQLLHQQSAYDMLIHSEVVLPHRDQLRIYKILRRSTNPTGRSVGTYHDNPILNSLVYDVEFPDGEVKEFAANIIAENILFQVNSEGFTLTVFDRILKSNKDKNEIDKKDLYYSTRSGTRRIRKTTCGWKLLVLW